VVPYRGEVGDLHGEFERRHGRQLDRVVLEIGFGMGEATIEIARANPDVGYLGVEVHKPGVGKVLSEIASRGLTNLLVMHNDVVPVLRDVIPRRFLSGVHIFFPDPWPKKRHHKRRLVQTEFVRLLVTRIAPGGYVYAVTDWDEYAHRMREIFDGIGILSNPYGGFAEEIPWRPTTSFERKGKQKRHNIRELYYEKSH
jgi:tRNA (guanine-N7-)-methyltransferase